MSEKKKILKSTYRPEFTIPLITKLEGIKTKTIHESDRFASPIFGTRVMDKIVVPETDEQFADTGKRFDAFRDVPRNRKKGDYSDFHILNTQSRVEVLGGQVVEEELNENNIKEEVKSEKVILKPNNEDTIIKEEESEPIFKQPDEDYEKIEKEESKTINLKPLEEEINDFTEPTPSLHKSNGFESVAGFENLTNENNQKPKNINKKAKSIKPKEEKVVSNQKYKLPDPKMFEQIKNNTEEEPKWLLEHVNIINDTLDSFNIDAKVIGHVKGPTVTRYEVSIGPGVRSNRITGISDNLQMNLQATSIRIETPVPGKPFAGLEVANVNPEMVPFGNVVNDKEFLENKNPLKVALGVDIDGKNVYVDISKMPHGLIAGATNSGKSVCVNTLISSLLIKNTPEELKLILIDPKIVEFAPYQDLPHLVTPVITDAKMASEALKWVVNEMENRYKRFARNRSRDIKIFNENVKLKRIDEEHMPYIVVFIEELADLMNVAASDVELSIQRITQKARAAGIHLIVATQRPSTDVVKGTIKSNIPSRIAFKVSSHVDSSTILDTIGAEKLLGKGDMLLKGSDRLIRLQGAYISDDEIYDLTNFIRDQREPNYLLEHESLTERFERGSDEKDELFNDVAYFVVSENVASINRITTEFGVGFNRAQSIVKMLEQFGIVSTQEGTKSREVLISIEELEEMLNEDY